MMNYFLKNGGKIINLTLVQRKNTKKEKILWITIEVMPNV